jgi:AraC-like DNA-binding protein
VPETAYAERGPWEVLRPFVVCTWTQAESVAAIADPASSDRILPDGCVDIVWDGHTAFVAGPDTGPVLIVGNGAATSYAGIRFRPGAGSVVLGVPACDLRDQRVPLDVIWSGAQTRGLTDRLARAATPHAAADDLQRTLVGRLSVPVDPLVTQTVAAIVSNPSLRASGLAERLGVTDRTLHRRVRSAVGYGPKVLQRVVRFRRFLALAHDRDGGVSLARLAHDAGYADQAHLTRECRALAGLTPRQLVRRSDVRLVQDGLTPVRPGFSPHSAAPAQPGDHS